MAEEKVDGLEGLDDFEDDFGEQLDSFMENDGEEESDTELDSFFEDLSTIDDLDGDDVKEKPKHESDEDVIKDGSKSESTKNNDHEEKTIHDGEVVEEISNKKKKTFPLKAVIFSSITGLLLGIISLILVYFLSNSSKKETPEVVLKKSEPKSITKKIKPVTKVKPKIKVIKKKKKIVSKPIPKETSYKIQVASCISIECLDESRTILKNMGYETIISGTTKNTGIA